MSEPGLGASEAAIGYRIVCCGPAGAAAPVARSASIATTASTNEPRVADRAASYPASGVTTSPRRTRPGAAAGRSASSPSSSERRRATATAAASAAPAASVSRATAASAAGIWPAASARAAFRATCSSRNSRLVRRPAAEEFATARARLACSASRRACCTAAGSSALGGGGASGTASRADLAVSNSTSVTCRRLIARYSPA